MQHRHSKNGDDLAFFTEKQKRWYSTQGSLLCKDSIKLFDACSSLWQDEERMRSATSACLRYAAQATLLSRTTSRPLPRRGDPDSLVTIQKDLLFKSMDIEWASLS